MTTVREWLFSSSLDSIDKSFMLEHVCGMDKAAQLIQTIEFFLLTKNANLTTSQKNALRVSRSPTFSVHRSFSRALFLSIRRC